VKPKPREQIEYEKVAIGEFVNGIIEEVERDEEHQSSYQGKPTIRDCVRFKFKLSGYDFPHYSRWCTFSYGEKANLYIKYLSKLVPEAEPDMDYDIELLKNMKVRTIWAEEKGKDGKVYQHIESIFPLKESGANKKFDKKMEEIEEPPYENEVPF